MENINSHVLELFDEMKTIRREIHKNPELLYELPNTTSLVTTYLSSLSGVEVYSQVGRSGVIGVLKSDGGPCYLLRADMDALAIQEENNVEYKSQIQGRMHACGHDAHVAMLLIAAKVISNFREKLKGSLKFLFQPAEEGEFGAQAMINDPLYPALENPDVEQVYGLHITASEKIGDVLISSKYASCYSSYFYIDIIGKGGHASTPHLSIDPIHAGAHIVLDINTILSKYVDPQTKASIAVTTFHSGEVFNAIPHICKISGTIRCFEPETKETIEKRITNFCRGSEISFGCEIKLEFQNYYPPTINSPEPSQIAGNAFKKICPGANINNLSPLIGEDFSYFTEKKPGCFIMMGCGDSQHTSHLHSSTFDFDERAMLIGASYWVELVKDILT
ncbi:unnamed protein product [Blepharisma stoltei]|uniref:Peptidase M20 dimerisation domain-containing protein n=1 Tax=Blepharisma stoltei TaxID=1481888 RepID=A0AAU9K997_9CILI|nr:unnamed protein product [Blepharisma stoltei]